MKVLVREILDLDKESHRSFDGQNGGLEELEIEKEFYHESSASRNSTGRSRCRASAHPEGTHES